MNISKPLHMCSVDTYAPDTMPCVAFCPCKVPTSGGHFSAANSTLRIRHVRRLILFAVSLWFLGLGSVNLFPLRCPLFPLGFLLIRFELNGI